MINEKLILETLANQTTRVATLQENFAAILAFLETHLPDLSQPDREMLKKGANLFLSAGDSLSHDAERLRQAIRKL